MNVSESITFRTAATWARYSMGTASANRALKPTPSGVRGIAIRKVTTIMVQIWPDSLGSQGRKIKAKKPSR